MIINDTINSNNNDNDNIYGTYPIELVYAFNIEPKARKTPFSKYRKFSEVRELIDTSKISILQYLQNRDRVKIRNLFKNFKRNKRNKSQSGDISKIKEERNSLSISFTSS